MQYSTDVCSGVLNLLYNPLTTAPYVVETIETNVDFDRAPSHRIKLIMRSEFKF